MEKCLLAFHNYLDKVVKVAFIIHVFISIVGHFLLLSLQNDDKCWGIYENFTLPLMRWIKHLDLED